MTTAVVAYERGSTFITNISRSKTCYGLVGRMTVGGTVFDTLERFSKEGLDYVHLAQKDHVTAVMYWDGKKKRRVLNPLNGRGQSKQYNNILVHQGEVPSHFEGCIGPGKLARIGHNLRMTGGKEALDAIWTYAGGRPGVKEDWSADALKVVFRVVNAFPDRAGLRPHPTN